ncbi:MAG: hypothetical protein JST00_12185 [Deltaproteobacteria bacterium]|nr:hypothetical protein [Deltaproteobacteria bacterium]
MSRSSAPRKGGASIDGARALAVVPPRDLERMLAVTQGAAIGDFLSRSAKSTTHDLEKLLALGRKNAAARATLVSLLAGAVPFGTTRSGELWVYMLAEPTSPARGVVAVLDPAVPHAPRLAFRDVATLALDAALAVSLATAREEEDEREIEKVEAAREKLAAPGVAEQEAMRAAFERASVIAELLLGNDAAVRRAARRLALRPLDVPPIPSTRKTARGSRLALGPTVEGFFRNEVVDEALAVVCAQKTSQDDVVREAAALLEGALADRPRTALAKDLARRRALAARAATARANAVKDRAAPRLELTKKIVEHIDTCPAPADPLTVSEAREEALLALAELGDRSVVPSLIARAVTGDASAVEMLGALGDVAAVGPLVDIVRREPQRNRQLEVAVVRTLAVLGAKTDASQHRSAIGATVCRTLRAMLEENPMPSWREGIERSVLVRELVSALGALADHEAAPMLHHVLEERGQEYRAILPTAAWALGRVRHLPALAPIERILSSPKEPVTCEAVWAVGEIGVGHASAKARAAGILENLSGLEPGAEMVRLTALAKLNGLKGASKTAELRRALERALWEPGFRQEETARRRSWALRSLEEIAKLTTGRSRKRRPLGEDPFFLGHEAVRYFVTRDDHRLRRAAEEAFTACGIPVPTTTRYFACVLDDVEARGGLDALHDALRDPLGIYRHNVASRLADRKHASSVRPLAEATARLFAEPPTSTYEYDDSPRAVVAFVRAIAKMNAREGNDVLIDALRSGNHQVRAVVAENAPEDERFVPELMAMLGDPRSFIRSRAERSLASMGVRGASGSDAPPPRLVEV